MAAAGMIAGGIGLAMAGAAWGAVFVCAGIGLTGPVDRRLPLLAALVVGPSLTAFHGLVLMPVGTGVLDFRLLLTGGLAIAVGMWPVIDRARPTRAGALLIGLVAVFILLAPTNDVAPLQSLPVIARWLVYAGALVTASLWLPGPANFALTTAALVIGMLVPALSGLVQFATGTAPQLNEASRLSGVYGPSPVGLGLAMLLAALALAGSAALRRRPRTPVAWASIVLFAVLVFVLVGTATRLVFVSLVGGLIVIEVLHRRYLAIPVVLAAAVAILALQPELVGRLTSVVPGGIASPSPTPSPIVPTPSLPVASPVVPASPPSESFSPEELPPGGEVTVSDSSLRFRMYIWTTMLPVWAESPVLGHGTGSFAELFEARSGISRVAPHNDYLGIGVETGLVGVGLYLVLQASVIGRLLVPAVRSVASPERSAAIAGLTLFLSCNVVNAINNPMLFVDLQVATWAIVGSALATASRPTGD